MPTCVKCGACEAHTRWFPAAADHPERLRRICKRCEFVWHEAPADAPPAPPAEPEPVAGSIVLGGPGAVSHVTARVGLGRAPVFLR
jgi:hypothetical protein